MQKVIGKRFASLTAIAACTAALGFGVPVAAIAETQEVDPAATPQAVAVEPVEAAASAQASNPVAEAPADATVLAAQSDSAASEDPADGATLAAPQENSASSQDSVAAASRTTTYRQHATHKVVREVAYINPLTGNEDHLYQEATIEGDVVTDVEVGDHGINIISSTYKNWTTAELPEMVLPTFEGHTVSVASSHDELQMRNGKPVLKGYTVSMSEDGVCSVPYTYKQTPLIYNPVLCPTEVILYNLNGDVVASYTHDNCYRDYWGTDISADKVKDRLEYCAGLVGAELAPNQTLPDAYKVSGNGVDPHVLTALVVDPATLEPEDIRPEEAEWDLWRTPTRTIVITKPNGDTQTTCQQVHWGRNVTLDQLTNSFMEYGHWRTMGDDTPNWDAVAIPAIQGYDPSVTNVDAKCTNAETPDEYLTVDYAPTSAADPQATADEEPALSPQESASPQPVPLATSASAEKTATSAPAEKTTAAASDASDDQMPATGDPASAAPLLAMAAGAVSAALARLRRRR